MDEGKPGAQHRSKKQDCAWLGLHFVEAEHFYQLAHQVSRALVHPRRYQHLLHGVKTKIPSLVAMGESSGSF